MNIKDAYIGKFKVCSKISAGAFGVIYEGECKESKKKVAMKFEKKPGSNQIRQEYAIYKCLRSDNNYTCKVHHAGVISVGGVKSDVLIMDLLGPSLESLFNYCNRQFSLKTVLMLAEMIITRVEYMHYKHIIHRDIKPDNFAFGLLEGSGPIGERLAKNVFCVIDFGLSCMYRSTRTYTHVPIQMGKGIIGTVRYTSLNVHAGIRQSRRDDLESLAYVLIYFARGKLPWQSIRAKTKEEKYKKIEEVKKNISVPDELCAGLDPAFAEFLLYARSLSFSEMPDYLYIKKIFSDAMVRNNFLYDFEFDWYRKYAETKEPIHRNMRAPPHPKSSDMGCLEKGASEKG